MQIKGVAFLGRKDGIVKQFGADQWESFFKKVIENLPFFENNIIATTLIPVDDFLSFNDMVLAEFFRGDKQVYWELGEKSAQWALTEGPYQPILKEGSVETFITKGLPTLWDLYYTEGGIITDIRDEIIEIKIVGIPYYHEYFEFLTMGFIAQGLKLLGAGEKLKIEKVESPTRGHTDILYKFHGAM
jgi:hypothetical protein